MLKTKIIIGLLLAIALLVPVQAQEDGLVAEWHFDEGAGNVLKDSSGNGNDGTIYGATWVEGKFGKALSFDGISNYVSVADASSLKPTQITVAAWINPNSFMDWGTVVTKSSNNNWNDGYGLVHYTGSNNINFFVNTYNNNKASIDIPIGQWSHVIGTYDGSNIKLYVNGLLVNSFAYLGLISNSDQPLLIGMGAGSGGNQYLWKGFIDEVRIYNRALSPEEVKQQYESGTSALSLTKTATPQSIKPGQTTTITLTVKNTGSTEITDIEIADLIPKDLILIDGETKTNYVSLSPQDSRQFQYSVQINEAGTFNLGQATASYADNKGNYQTIKSKPASIEVIPSLVTDAKQTPAKKSNSNAQSASVNLHGEKTDVELGENVLLKLSAVNIIGNPAMHVQVIIIPPSGWSVTSSEFAESGAGQYSTTYDLKSGGGKDIEVRIVPNQVGEDFKVEGRIVYYFGDDVATREDHTLNLPIKVRAKSNAEMTTAASPSDKPSTPGFAFVVGLLGLVGAMRFIKRK